jgi:drug/metabolite transporter (DMT)-like permease
LSFARKTHSLKVRLQRGPGEKSTKSEIMPPEIEAALRTTQNVTSRQRAMRAYSLLALFIALRACGNLSLAWGTKHQPQTLSIHPLAYLQSMLDPFVASGIVMLILALFARLALLSLADLSFVLPVTAIGYVLAAILGKFVLHEQVTSARWLAAVLIFTGAALVGSTPQDTTKTGDAVE